MMTIIKKYWNKFLDWEGTVVEFDRGWALVLVTTAILVVVK